jgi:E1A-binding protein p400
MLEIVKEFVFVLPLVVSAGPRRVLTRYSAEAYVEQKQAQGATASMQGIVEDYIAPFYPSYIRQKIYFPDRKLVQFDSGKLQALYTLLDRLKKGGHKCLIFTQMSKMLDILEIFLNLHAHTYVRLDGSTVIKKRQRLVDRFNTDPKIFVFILSTRSGGLGINLTGADSVIFYDSDWNPAMDAQAQDRAHRIGQTREVHIYRMVCTSTVEENILTKAKQKRHLDFWLCLREMLMWGLFSPPIIYPISSRMTSLLP